MLMTPAHGFLFVCVHHTDNVHNVTVTGHIYCLSHFLACTNTVHKYILSNFLSHLFYNIYVYFIVHFITV